MDIDFTRFAHSEVLAAAPDFIAHGLGVRAAMLHPLAKELDLQTIAFAYGRAARAQQEYERDGVVVTRGMQSQKFADLLLNEGNPIVLSAYDVGAREYLGFCAVTEMRDYKAEEVINLDGDAELRQHGEVREIGRARGFSHLVGAELQVRKFARMFAIYREWLLANQLGAIGDLFRLVGVGGAQLEAENLALLLRSNPVLADGQPVFSVQNTISSALDASSLTEAMGTLRSQGERTGRAFNLSAKHLIVAPGLEYPAKKLVADANLGVQVYALAGLPVGRWFLLPDPAIHPVVSILRLAGTKTPLFVAVKRDFQTDDILVRVTATTDAAFLRRSGIVRGGTDL